MIVDHQLAIAVASVSLNASDVVQENCKPETFTSTDAKAVVVDLVKHEPKAEVTYRK